MKIDNKDLANSIRFLSVDAVQRANSGHPGMPMGMADVATILFKNFIKFDPANPSWINRDRFILSAGHGSMLLYSLLYLTGYKSVSLKDIKNFRQLNSICAGHPEFEQNSGIETTTGPLGQGISNAVGFALAEEILKAQYGKKIINHKTFIDLGLVKSTKTKVKLLAKGQIKNKIDIEVSAHSKSAKEGIEKIGGSIAILENRKSSVNQTKKSGV